MSQSRLNHGRYPGVSSKCRESGGFHGSEWNRLDGRTKREGRRTGPVLGFLVDDIVASTEELKQNGIELLGAPGPSWQHFRGPDGNVYELKQRG